MKVRSVLMLAILFVGFTVTAVAQIFNVSQNSFVGGEISPLMAGRRDVAQYSSSCRTLENALVIDAGAMTRRTGSLYIATAPGEARLEPFVYNSTDVYIMEFTHELLRFYREVSGTPGIVLDANSVPYDVNTPWDGNDVFQLSIHQKGDILYVAHRDYSTRKISRYGHTDWRIEDCNELITDGPFKDENTDTAVTIDPPDETADVTSGETFDANDAFAGYVAGEAFDNSWSLNQGWLADDIANTWISVQYAAPKTITRIKIWPCMNTANSAYNLRHCKIEASADGATWVKLSVNRWYGRCTGYLGDEIEIPRFANYTDYADVRLDNDTAYSYYRVWCYDNWGDASYLSILEMEMMEAEGGTFIANSGIWDANHIGSIWELSHPRDDSETNGAFTTFAQWSTAVPVKGDWDVGTTGTWSGTLVLQRSYDYGASWESFRTWEDAGTIDATGTEEDWNVWYRLNLTAYSAGTCNYSLSARDGLGSGIIRITAVADDNEVTADILAELSGRDPTYRWSEGAWSKDEGYPEAVAGHQARLVFAKDLTLWWSASNNKFETFEAGTNDDDSFSFTLNQARQNPILWLSGDRSQGIVAGTSRRLLDLQPFDETVGFRPTNPPKVKSTVAMGTLSVQPVMADESLLYVSETGRRVHEMLYGSDSMTAPDLTLLSSHILGTGSVQMAWQMSPYPCLWVVRADGQMATMYYSRVYKVAAWSRQVTDGNYTSIAVAPRASDTDRVWCVVNRTVDSNSVYYVECFEDLDPASGTNFLDSSLTFDGGDSADVNDVTQAEPGIVTLESWPTGLTDGDNIKFASVAGMTELNGEVYVADDCNSVALTLTLDLVAGGDCNTADYTAYTSGGTLQIVENAFGGLTHLEGETIQALGDGVYVGEYAVSSGAVTLDDYYNEVVLGLGYTTTLVPVEVDTVGSVGTTTSKGKAINGLLIDVYETGGEVTAAAGKGMKYGASASTLYGVKWPQQSGSTVNDLSYRWTGPHVLPMSVGPRRNATYTIVQDGPYPMTIRGLDCLFTVGN